MLFLWWHTSASYMQEELFQHATKYYIIHSIIFVNMQHVDMQHNLSRMLT